MPETLLDQLPEEVSHKPHEPKSHSASETHHSIEQQPLIDFEELYGVLAGQVEAIQKQFKTKHRHLLRWAANHGYHFEFLQDAGSKAALAGGLMASLIMSTPQQLAKIPLQQHQAQMEEQQSETKLHQAYLARKKYQMTAQATAQRHAQEQQQLTQQLQDAAAHHSMTTNATLQDQAASWAAQLTGVPATAQLDGYRLNTTIGRVGAEQHLKRYPGDAINEHNFAASGFAPGLGAYGYFAANKASLNSDAAAREQYYVAVQTFLSPNWNGNVHQAYDWFKYRKVVVYDPWTNKAVVADVADSGPGAATGKAFGGSPEVMAALGAHDGYGSPPVMLFFVDDPNNKVPLGPVDFVVDGGQ